MNIDNRRIVLASNSPRRKELLNQIGIEFDVIVSDAEEKTTKEAPYEVVMELSKLKALAVAEKLPSDGIVIGADTVVWADGKILGKPHSRGEAYEMISKLSGCEHSVYTGVTIICDGRSCSFYEETRVIVRTLSEECINEYLATGEYADKAGAYGIQGYFARYVKGIVGDYYNVVGLPLSRLMQELEDM